MLDDARNLADLDRRFGAALSYGTIEEADYPAARVRVRFTEDHVSGWLPWLTPRAAGNEQVWDAPEIGEKVIVLAPDGALEAGCVLGALFSPASPAPAASATRSVSTRADGASDTYDRDTHTRLISLPDSGKMTIVIGMTQVRISDGLVEVASGNIRFTADSELRLEANSIILDSGSIDLGGEGGEPVARKDDPVASGVISAGSTKVRSA